MSSVKENSGRGSNLAALTPLMTFNIKSNGLKYFLNVTGRKCWPANTGITGAVSFWFC